jgi:hypothetical protein
MNRGFLVRQMVSPSTPVVAFFAYPSRQSEVIAVIRGAKAILSTSKRALTLNLWEENEISGRSLTDPIFGQISACNFLIADITALNFNVTFEIGYAIALKKRVYLGRSDDLTI